MHKGAHDSRGNLGNSGLIWKKKKEREDSTKNLEKVQYLARVWEEIEISVEREKKAGTPWQGKHEKVS